jgi:glutathione S-transferase
MTLSAPAIILTAAVTLLAILISIGLQINTGKVRSRTGIKPPAMSGAPALEAALRAEGNTVEQYVLFLPALWLAALYFQGWVPPLVGLVWCLGRVLYAIGYMSAPDKRYPGYMLTVLSALVLIVLAGIGIVQAWMVA